MSDRTHHFAKWAGWLLVVALAGLLAASCGTRQGASESVAPRSPAPGDVAPQTMARAAMVIEVRSPELLAIPGVNGVGVGSDEHGAPIALVLLERGDVTRVPRSLDGLAVGTVVVGPLKAFALTGRYRPVAIGVSAGNALQCLPGTIGCVVTAGTKRCLLSANHVFARQNRAVIGEAICQPSLPDVDSTCTLADPRTLVARLSDFEPVIYDGRTPNRFDAAIAELKDTDASCATLPAFYGLPASDPADPVPGAPILKVGRTTGLTRGTIKAVDLKVKITFPAGTALFVGQILTSKAFGDFGDSGSLVVTDDDQFHPLAIVIGGGSNGVTIASPIGPILERFNATVCGR